MELDFFIKQNTTLPELKFPLTQTLMEKYNITDDMMENVAVTFSMIDHETGKYKIANAEAKLTIIDISEYEHLDDTKYNLVYCFKEKDTKRTGQYGGKFSLIFLD